MKRLNLLRNEAYHFNGRLMILCNSIICSEGLYLYTLTNEIGLDTEIFLLSISG